MVGGGPEVVVEVVEPAQRRIGAFVALVFEQLLAQPVVLLEQFVALALGVQAA